MKELHIAIIDDGINEKLYTTGKLKHNIQITPELLTCQRADYDPFKPSHGTTCAAIIKQYAPKAVLSSIKILNDDSHRGMKAQLIRALEWCAENEIRLVNLSLGTIDYRDFVEIEKAVKCACAKNIIIVAACNNHNVFTCPASLYDVIGVKCDTSETLKEREYIYHSLSLDGIDITACGSHKLEKYTGESKITSVCNSFATPVITAFAWGIIENNPSICFYELKEELKEKSVKPKDIKNRRKFYSYSNYSIDIPVIVVYNYYGKKINHFSKKLTQKFRINDYNAISIYTDEAEKDLCNGSVSIKSHVNGEKNSFIRSIQRISNIYDPDIIIVPIDMTIGSQELYLKEIERYMEVDIRINIYNTLSLEIICNNETKTFTFLNDTEIDDVYYYILSSFNKDEEKNETTR
jgi:hypothetical protein